MLGALFPPNGRYALLVALIPAPVLLICAKHLFVAAIDGWGLNFVESADQNMTAGSVAFGAGAVLKGPAKQADRLMG